MDREQLLFLVEQAARAPSSHNTQPWNFRLGERSIALYADPTRALPVNDPDDRELTISCGCALFNLRVAAAHAGLEARMALLPDPTDPTHLADVHLEPASAPAPEGTLFDSISRRQTYRRGYTPREIEPTIVAELTAAATAETAALFALSDDEQRRAVAALIAEGDANQWADRHWRRELAAWMHPRRRGDGLAVPGLIAPLAQTVVGHINMGATIALKDRTLANESPLLTALCTERDEPIDWLAAGQALERVLLVACSHGLQAGYANQPVQVATLRPKLRELLGTQQFPQILMRLGYPSEEQPMSPRRPLTDAVE